jgi:hypothetical protein
LTFGQLTFSHAVHAPYLVPWTALTCPGSQVIAVMTN